MCEYFLNNCVVSAKQFRNRWSVIFLRVSGQSGPTYEFSTATLYLDVNIWNFFSSLCYFPPIYYYKTTGYRKSQILRYCITNISVVGFRGPCYTIYMYIQVYTNMLTFFLAKKNCVIQQKTFWNCLLDWYCSLFLWPCYWGGRARTKDGVGRTAWPLIPVGTVV